jgi:hypothetical protein
VVRGYDGTTARRHAAGKEIGNYLTAWDINALRKEVIAIEAMLGTNLSNVPNSAGARDIRNDGAVCDGTDSNEAVQEALDNGHTRLFIPAGCTWVVPQDGNGIPAGVWVIGEDSKTSRIKAAADPTTYALIAQPRVRLSNVNALGNSCSYVADDECQVDEYRNYRHIQDYVILSGRTVQAISIGPPADDPAMDIALTNIRNYGLADGWYAAQMDGGGVAVRIENASNTAGATGLLVRRLSTGAGMTIQSDTGAEVNGTDMSFFTANKTSGYMMAVNQRGATFTGDILNFWMADVSGGFSGNVLVYRNSATQWLKINRYGTYQTKGAIATEQGSTVVANGTNYTVNPGASGNAGIARLTGATGAFEINGIVPGADGQHLTIWNSLGQQMTIRHLDGSATASYRVFNPQGTDVTCPSAQYCVATLFYDDIADLWVLVSVR